MGNGGTGERGNGTLLVKIEECGSILQEKSKISPSLARTFIWIRVRVEFVQVHVLTQLVPSLARRRLFASGSHEFS